MSSVIVFCSEVRVLKLLPRFWSSVCGPSLWLICVVCLFYASFHCSKRNTTSMHNQYCTYWTLICHVMLSWTQPIDYSSRLRSVNLFGTDIVQDMKKLKSDSKRIDDKSPPVTTANSPAPSSPRSTRSSAIGTSLICVFDSCTHALHTQKKRGITPQKANEIHGHTYTQADESGNMQKINRVAIILRTT